MKIRYDMHPINSSTFDTFYRHSFTCQLINLSSEPTFYISNYTKHDGYKCDDISKTGRQTYIFFVLKTII